MEWLVKVPEELEQEIDDKSGGCSIDKVNEAFRTLSTEPYLEKGIITIMAEEALNRTLEHLPVLIDADKGKHKSRFLFDLDGFYVSRFCIAEHSQVDDRTVNTVIKAITEVEGEEEWNLVDLKESKSGTHYYRMDRRALFQLLRPLFEENVYELSDDELEEGFEIFVKNSYMPLKYLTEKDDGLYFTLLQELLINIGEEYRNIQRRRSLEEGETYDKQMEAAEELGVTDTFVPDFMEYSSEEYLRFVEETYEKLRSTLPEREMDGIRITEEEEFLKGMLVGHKTRNL